MTKNIRCVFALTSSGRDKFTAMTRLAVASIRATNPGSEVIIACDAESDKLVRKARDPLIEEIDGWIIVETGKGSMGFRNRFVKTMLRNLVSGRFLFLDSDILVKRDLSEMFWVECDFAAARNHSRRCRVDQIGSIDKAVLKKLNWKTSKEVYFNGGVLLFADTSAARSFSAEWHRLWCLCNTRLGGYRDQPSLNAALENTKPEISVLSDKFNAQWKGNPSAAIDAAIWHYYSSDSGFPPTVFEHAVQSLLDGGRLEPSLINDLIHRKYPWFTSNVLDRVVSKRLVKYDSYHNWEGAWMQRDLVGFSIAEGLAKTKCFLLRRSE
jgi:hypothetical protein